LIYYASNLEEIKTPSFNPGKKTSFLYLGKLTESKGAKIYKELVDKYQLKLLFLGKAYDSAANALVEDENAIALGNFNSADLKSKLFELMQTYNLVGLSIIIPENKSYELQEANKDIDYMAMGMPFIGNDRKPTYEKIKLGAGVLYSNDEKVKAIIANKGGMYDKCSEQGREAYKNYCRASFERKLLEVYNTK
jgi:hypothetical protein